MTVNVIIGLFAHIALLLNIAMVVLVIRTRHPSPMRSAFLNLLFLMIVWNSGILLEMDFRFLTGVTFMPFINISFIGTCFVPVAIFYLGRVIQKPEWHPKPIHAVFLIIPLLSVILVFTDPLHHLFFVKYSPYSSEALYGPYFYFHSVYSYLCIACGIVLMIISYANNSGLLSMQSLLVVSGILITLVPNILYSYGVVDLPASISAAAFTITTLFFTVAFLKYRFISTLPINTRQVVDLISDGYLVIDKQLNILTYNRALKHLFPEYFTIKLGESFRPVLERYFMNIAYDYFLQLQNQAIVRHRTITTEAHILGSTYVTMEITPIIQRNTQIGTIVLLKDITQSKLLIESAKAASIAKSNFLAKMSHEIRTPMNAIIGMTELAIRETDPYAKNSHILTIKQAGSNLLAIINDILDFSKIETGKLEIVPVNYTFTSLLNDVISIIRMRIIDLQIRFAVNIDRNIPNKLFGDETRIRQALLNVLNNAVKYTEKGFVSLIVNGEIKDSSNITIVMEVMDSGRGIKENDIKNLFTDFTQFDLEKNRGIEGVGLGLSITNSIITAMGGSINVQSQYGKGSLFTLTIPQKYLNREVLASVENPREKKVLIYERRVLYANSIIFTIDNLDVPCELVTGDSELQDKLKNTKYSFLFISFQLYKRNKDTILQYGNNVKVVVLSEFGETIPDKNLSVLAMPVYSTTISNILNGITESFSYNNSTEVIARFTAPDAKVLIVDDINTNLKVAKGLLLPYKIEADLCKNGKEAVAAIQAHRYDLVFMDQKMPEMDGVEATGFIRNLGKTDAYYKDLPIVALTANAIAGTEDFLLKTGFNDFLSKPIDTVKLNLILEKWIPVEKQKILTQNVFDTIDEKTVDIDGVDVSKGVSFSGGTMSGYMDTLTVFYDDGIKKINQIKTCLETDNLPLYTTHVHGLKSAAALIGADNLSALAKALEIAGDQGDMTYIEAHNPYFLQNMESLLDKINDFLITAAKNSKTETFINTEMLKSKLSELNTALVNFDAGGMNTIIESLLELTQDTDIHPAIRKISDKILISEYEGAAALVDTLLHN